MAKIELEEVSGWDDVYEQAGTDSYPARAQAQAKSAKKISFAIAHLTQSVFDAQKHISICVEDLTTEVRESSKSSDGLTKAALVLSAVIALATVAQVLLAIFKS
jgi:hypothetical protein